MTSLSRRELLRLLALASAQTAIVSGCKLLPCLPRPPLCADLGPWAKPSAPLAIDVHAHIFNASDLPIRGFASRVLLNPKNRDDLAKVGELLGPILLELAWNAPTTGEERVLLDLLAIEMEQCPAAGALSPTVLRRRTNQFEVARSELRAASQRVQARPQALSVPARIAIDQINQLTTYEDLLQRLESAPGAVHTLEKSVLSALYFVIELFQYRIVSLFTYLDTVGTSGAHGIDLMLSALVDYDWWLDPGTSPVSSLDDQVDLGARISELMHGRVHLWAPFCPLREVLYQDHVSESSSLALVKRAVTEQAAIGVKLYPPMGFKAYDNASIEPPPWPEAQWLPAVTRTPEFGRRLDDALARLYDWCQQEDVPILAHTRVSNGALPDLQALADERGWTAALAKWSNLRVVFGHFGGAEESALKDHAAGFVQLLSSAPHAGPDASYFERVLANPVELSNTLLELFKPAIDAEGLLASRFCFGSDWKMLAAQEGASGYLRAEEGLVERIATGLDADRASRLRSGFFANNAARALGLHKGDPARNRLQAFYDRWKIEPMWTRKLDGG
ncbi:MAG TPA: hypothetical protein VMR50_13165 [Myxococcota bacterium]|nr:hypothetical protein [Myxococcota bacterium]